MSKSKLMAILIGIALAAGIMFFMFRQTPEDEGKNSSLFASLSGLWGSGSEESDDSLSSSDWLQSGTGEPDARQVADGLSDFTAYAHPELPFSFGYPQNMSFTAFEEDGAEVLLFAGGGNEFQLSIRPFDEPGPMTEERIKRDLPTLNIEQPQQALIGPEKDMPALIFLSQDPAAGKIREVWFVHDGYLYQVSAYEEFDAMLATVMGTWRFYNSN